MLGLLVQRSSNSSESFVKGNMIMETLLCIDLQRKGKTVITEELCERVRDILTSSPTETIDSARERLRNDGVDVSRSIVYRMARSQYISHQMIVPKPAAVFTRRITQQRFDYA